MAGDQEVDFIKEERGIWRNCPPIQLYWSSQTESLHIQVQADMWPSLHLQGTRQSR